MGLKPKAKKPAPPTPAAAPQAIPTEIDTEAVKTGNIRDRLKRRTRTLFGGESPSGGGGKNILG